MYNFLFAVFVFFMILLSIIVVVSLYMEIRTRQVKGFTHAAKGDSGENEDPYAEFIKFILEIIKTIFYISGVAVVELFLRPLFHEAGVPFLSELIITGGEIYIFVAFIIPRSFFKWLSERVKKKEH